MININNNEWMNDKASQNKTTCFRNMNVRESRLRAKFKLKEWIESRFDNQACRWLELRKKVYVDSLTCWINLQICGWKFCFMIDGSVIYELLGNAFDSSHTVWIT